MQEELKETETNVEVDARKQVSGTTKSGEEDKDFIGKKEESEKKASVVEAGKEMEKAAAKQAKHFAVGKIKQPKHQHRKALQK